jgi:membrane protease YdiL (CAAX protease family)
VTLADVENLPATPDPEAVKAVVLACLASCFLLAVYPPRRTALAETPHHVPPWSLLVAMLWFALAASSTYGDAAAQSASEVLSLEQLAVTCVVGLSTLLVAAASYVGPQWRRFFPARETTTMEPAAGTADDAEGPAVPRRTTPDWLHQVSVGFTVGLAAFFLTQMLGLLRPEQTPEEMHVLLRTLRAQGKESLLLIALSAVVIAPLTEELLCRVVLQGWLADRIGRWAIPTVAGAFAAVHGPSDGPLLIPLALILGVLYEYRRSYVEIAAAHAVFNATNVFLALSL